MLSPCERRHIAIFVHRLVMDEAKALPKRGGGVQVGAVIEQHAREVVTPTQADRRRDDAREECGVTANPAASGGPVPAQLYGASRLAPVGGYTGCRK